MRQPRRKFRSAELFIHNRPFDLLRRYRLLVPFEPEIDRVKMLHLVQRQQLHRETHNDTAW